VGWRLRAKGTDAPMDVKPLGTVVPLSTIGIPVGDGTVNLAMIMIFFFFVTPRCSSSSQADTTTGCGSKIRIDHL
jgi:hypothetical protein